MPSSVSPASAPAGCRNRVNAYSDDFDAGYVIQRGLVDRVADWRRERLKEVVISNIYIYIHIERVK